jgi:hypothetical protein
VQACGLHTTKSAGSTRLLGKVADGLTTMQAGFGTRIVTMFEKKELYSNDIVRIQSSQVTQVDGQAKLMVLDLEVVGKYSGEDLLANEGEPPRKRAAHASAMSPAFTTQAPVSPSEYAARPWHEHSVAAHPSCECHDCPQCAAVYTVGVLHRCNGAVQDAHHPHPPIQHRKHLHFQYTRFRPQHSCCHLPCSFCQQHRQAECQRLGAVHVEWQHGSGKG